MAKTKFYIRNPYKDKEKKILNDKETKINLYIYFDRNNIIRLATPWMILPKEWDFRKEQRKESLPGSPEDKTNENLRKFKNAALSKYDEIKKQYPDLPFNSIRKKLIQDLKKWELPNIKKGRTMQEIFTEYLESMQGEYSKGSIYKAQTLRNVLIGIPENEKSENRKYPTPFIKVYPDFEPFVFSMIDHDFYNKFVKYLRAKKATGGRQKTRPEGEQDGLLEDTVGKYIESLRTFCKWAEKRGYNKNKTYREFKLVTSAGRKRKAKRSGGDIVTLTLPELKKLYHHDFSENERLERVRDLFCFACFTGQRWADITTIDINDIIGNDIWKLTAQKTSHETEIDLVGFHAPALDILKKYKYKLPVISSQQFNNYIKEAGGIAGIDTPVKIRRWVGSKKIEIEKPKYQFMSSHMGRRTCVSILLNDYSMSVSYVMGVTGHRSVNTLQKYIDIDRSARRRAAEKQINAMAETGQKRSRIRKKIG